MPICKSCKKEIVFLKTKTGKTIPVNADTLTFQEQSALIGRIEVTFDSGHHITHFADCPAAVKFRKGRKVKQ